MPRAIDIQKLSLTPAAQQAGYEILGVNFVGSYSDDSKVAVVSVYLLKGTALKQINLKVSFEKSRNDLKMEQISKAYDA